MKEWTYKGVWQVPGEYGYYIRIIHKVIAANEQLASERAFEWFMSYHKRSIPFKAHYIGMQLIDVK